MEILKIPTEKRDAATVPLTVTLLSLLTGFALVLKNVGFVVSFGGALIGSMLIYFVPAVMNIKNIQKAVKEQQGGQSSRGQSVELAANYGLATMGVVITIIGVFMNLKGLVAAH